MITAVHMNMGSLHFVFSSDKETFFLARQVYIHTKNTIPINATLTIK